VESLCAYLASNLLSRHPDKTRYIRLLVCPAPFPVLLQLISNGKALMNAITWMDARVRTYIIGHHRWVSEGSRIWSRKMLRWIHLTGGGPSLSGKDDIAHALLIKYAFPEIYEKTNKFLGSKDYFNLRLTGEITATFDSSCFSG
jgi:sugar (pentulose or hexulose) kinase